MTSTNALKLIVLSFLVTLFAVAHVSCAVNNGYLAVPMRRGGHEGGSPLMKRQDRLTLGRSVDNDTYMIEGSFSF
jgi:hypothetical protein